MREKVMMVPPAGSPIPFSAVIAALRWQGCRGESCEEILKRDIEGSYVYCLSSGRAAMTIVLEVLKRKSNRQEVDNPAYTCFSVPSAVARAGLSIRQCDVNPKTLDFDYNSLSTIALGKVLCIIPSSLYGLPSDLQSLEELSLISGAFLVDDAAQCLGGTVKGKFCGTFGDVGIYSLGRGKNITAMGGGILVTQRKDLAQRIHNDMNTLRRPSSLNVLSSIVFSLLYSAMLSPSTYWLLDRLPILGLGLSVFNPNFAIMHLSSYQKRLASRLLMLVHSYNRIRHKNARYLYDGIKRIDGIEIPQPGNGADPVYLRFPILTRDEKHRTRVINRLKAAGIGASASYPTPISDIPGIRRYLAGNQQDCPGARSIANRIITLPTHPCVTPRDIDRMVQVIRDT